MTAIVALLLAIHVGGSSATFTLRAPPQQVRACGSGAAERWVSTGGGPSS
ncbi:MAG: hypothetical protein ACYDCH_06945 [Gaiellaceae bacterium]